MAEPRDTRPSPYRAVTSLLRAAFVVVCLATVAALYHHGRLAGDVCGERSEEARAAAFARCEAFLDHWWNPLDVVGRNCPTTCE